jgi:hypothetical protein
MGSLEPTMAATAKVGELTAPHKSDTEPNVSRSTDWDARLRLDNPYLGPKEKLCLQSLKAQHSAFWAASLRRWPL